MRCPRSDRRRALLPECPRHGCAETRPTTHEADLNWIPNWRRSRGGREWQRLMSEQPTRNPRRSHHGEMAAEHESHEIQQSSSPAVHQSINISPLVHSATAIARRTPAGHGGFIGGSRLASSDAVAVPSLYRMARPPTRACRIVGASVEASERGNTRKQQPLADALRFARPYTSTHFLLMASIRLMLQVCVGWGKVRLRCCGGSVRRHGSGW